MLVAAATFLLALATSLALTPLVRRLAIGLGAIDRAGSSRHVHQAPVPRMGGLAIVAAFYLSLGVLALAQPEVAAALGAEAGVAALLLGGLVVAGVGLRDDLHGATAGAKLLVELAAAGLLYAGGWRIDAVDLPFLEPIALGWLSLPVTLLWVAGVTNAVNLIDGLDGLAAGVALVASAALGLLAATGGGPFAALAAAALAGGALGFLRHNFNPASVFMGDTGSLFLGFVLSALTLRAGQAGPNTLGLATAVLILGVPIGDTALAILRRALRGAPIFRADRGHLHHRLLAQGLGHRGAALALHAVSLLLAGAALLLVHGGDRLEAAVLAAVAVAVPAGLWRLGLRRASLRAALEDRRRNLALHASLRPIRASLRRADAWTALWPTVQRGVAAVGARGVTLHLAPRADGERAVAVSAGAVGQGLLRTRTDLESGVGALELHWRGPKPPDRDVEIAVEILSGELSEAVGRLGRRRASRAVLARQLVQAAAPTGPAGRGQTA